MPNRLTGGAERTRPTCGWLDTRCGLSRSTLNGFPGKSPYSTASIAPPAYRLPPLRPTAYVLPPTAHVFSSKSPYATASPARTAYHLPPLRPAAYGIRPTAYGLPFISPTAYRLPPTAFGLGPSPAGLGFGSASAPDKSAATHRDPGCLPCSRLWVGPSAYTLCS